MQNIMNITNPTIVMLAQCGGKLKVEPDLKASPWPLTTMYNGGQFGFVYLALPCEGSKSFATGVPGSDVLG